MKVLFFANTDWYLYNFRLPLACALRDLGHEVLLASPPGLYVDRLVEMGFRWVAVPMCRRSLNPIRELALLRRLSELVKLEQVDLVHGFTIKCSVYGSLAARWAARGEGRVVRINSIAGLGYVFTSLDLKARLLRPIVRLLLKLAFGGRGGRVIVQNGDDREFVVRARLADSVQVRVIRGSGVDCERFNCSRFADRRNESFRVLLPARLLWDKGLGEYIEASRILKRDGRSVSVLLAGDPDPGNPAEVPLATVRDWVDQGLVEWLGHVDDMAALFATVDVVVLPSYREGLPKSLIEAAACARPLVTTDVPGCREVVTDEVDGLLVPVRDAERLARAIARLQDDPHLRERLGNAARAKALAHFDERIVIAKTLEVYGEVLPTTPAATLPGYAPREAV